MCDGLITREDVQEALSRAYLSAVAAKARYLVSETNLDRDGIDLTVEAGADFRPKISFQLKATTTLGACNENGNYRYACPVKNYHKLIIPTQTPRLLLVYRMPVDEDRWLECFDNEALLRHSAYWVNLLGRPPTTRTDNITIDVPRVNRLTIDGLRALMERSRSGLPL